MNEEIQIIVIKRPYLGRGPDPQEIVRLFSRTDPFVLAARMHEPSLLTLGGRRKKQQTWYRYALLSALCGILAGSMALYLVMRP